MWSVKAAKISIGHRLNSVIFLHNSVLLQESWSLLFRLPLIHLVLMKQKRLSQATVLLRQPRDQKISQLAGEALIVVVLLVDADTPLHLSLKLWLVRGEESHAAHHRIDTQ